ncbi:MAG: electron transport complex subunit RsxE [Oscillospiraceae bacterium]|jgi:electron transport complex protein RnfE|nr:electron transport complex subunit RsxE [Oscillospiraceae bacterium]
MKSYLKTFTKGIIKENPVFFSLLGMCPTLALSNSAWNAVGLGVATMFVLTCSNMIISLLKNIIPSQVRIPCFITIIAGFTTFTSLLLKALLPDLYNELGIFLSLIAVNCIIFARAEIFAKKNNVFNSALDGLGTGLGFALALFIMGTIREILGAGTWFGLTLPELSEPMVIFIMPAGGFFALGFVIAAVNKFMKKRPHNISCDNCPHKGMCRRGEGD